MILNLERKKLCRTGYFPAILAGSLAASAFPIANMIVRSKTFTVQPGNALTILLTSNWQMMAMLNILTAVCTICIMYHTEFADRGDQKMSVLPVRPLSMFLCKLIIAAASQAFMILIESLILAGCVLFWFPDRPLDLSLLLQQGIFSWIMALPAVMLMLVIASLCKNMWISLGTGVILVFTFTIFQGGPLILSLLPFSTPYALYEDVVSEGHLLLYTGVCAAWVMGFALAGIFIQMILRHPPALRKVPVQTKSSTVRQVHTPGNSFAMGHFPILAVELMKIRRSKIFLILLAPVLLMWIPSVLNGNLALETASPSMSPEQNFFIQGFMGMVWFMIPATLVIITVLLTQTERQNRGLLKMLSLPVNTAKLCLTKFVLLLLLELVQIIMITGGYFISAALVSLNQGYSFMLDPLYVCRFAAEVYLTAIPMAALFWMIAVLIRTPVFAVGLGLASVVPAVLILNTRFWFAYPMCYPFYVLMVEYGKASQGIFTTSIQWLPWIPVAAVITGAALAIASIGFGFQRERG